MNPDIANIFYYRFMFDLVKIYYQTRKERDF